MNFLNIGIIFLFINFVFAEKSCTIEGNYEDKNIMKKVNIKCFNDKEYCEEIYPKIINIGTYSKSLLMKDCNGHYYGGQDIYRKNIKECYNKKTGKIVDDNLITLIDRLTGNIDCRDVKEHLIKCDSTGIKNGYDITDMIGEKEGFKCDYKYTGELKSKYEQCIEYKRDNIGKGGINELSPEKYCCIENLVGVVYRSAADCTWN